MNLITVFFFLIVQFCLFAQEDEVVFPQQIFDGRYQIAKNELGLFGVKTAEGKTIVPFVYQRIIPQTTGIVVYKTNKSTGYVRTYSCGFYAKSMQLILPCNYSSVLTTDEGLLVACQNKDRKYGLVDTTGRILVPFKYSEMSAPAERLICVKYETKYGYIDQRDKVIIPFKFEFATPFSEGLAVATTKKLFGFIDKRGQFEIPEKFTGANGFDNGYAEIFINDNASIIDPKGKIYFPFIFQSIKSVGNNQFVFEANDIHRGKLSSLLSSTSISTTIESGKTPTDSAGVYDDYNDLYASESSFGFQGVISATGQIIGGENFRTIKFLMTKNGMNYFAVQSVSEIEKENWNLALMDGNGKLLTKFAYLDIQLNEAKQKIEVVLDQEKGVAKRSIGLNGVLE